MAVASLVSMALASESESAVAVNVVIARLELTMMIRPTSKGIVLIVVNINAVDSVDKVFDEVEIDTGILLEFNIEEFGNCRHRELDAASTAGVSQFIRESALRGSGNMNIIIAGNRDEEELSLDRVNNCDHVDIREGTSWKSATTGVDTGKIHRERFRSNVVNLDALDVYFYFNFADNFSLVGKSGVFGGDTVVSTRVD